MANLILNLLEKQTNVFINSKTVSNKILHVRYKNICYANIFFSITLFLSTTDSVLLTLENIKSKYLNITIVSMSIKITAEKILNLIQ